MALPIDVEVNVTSAAPLVEIRAEVLGEELARLLAARAAALHSSADALAQALSLDAGRVRIELAYLAILTTEFCAGVALGETAAKARVVAAFEQAVWMGSAWRVGAAGVETRVREYRDAFSHPHPELGRAYVVGRTFARHCGCSLEVAAIGCGARAYIEQLPPALVLLRSVLVI